MRRNTAGALGIGVITIFTVLIVLSLSVFAMLTLSSARADLHLSEINADTVSSYYAADIEAHRLYNDFVSSDEEELEEDVFMNETQSLHLHFKRDGDKAMILAWSTVSGCEAEIDDGLNLWDGVLAG
ncbi:MAG: hypothetical protein AB7D36_00105 [Oscillospiraceae bacterium]